MSTRRTAAGERLYPDYEIRVCLPDQKDIVWRSHCERGKGWDAAILEQIIEKAAASAEKLFPSVEFRLVELAPNRVKFIYAGRKENMGEKLENLCPERAQSALIAGTVCMREGHNIVSLQSIQMTPQGMQPSFHHLCAKCGLSVSEIRDAVEQLVNAHIGNEVNRRMHAVAAAAKAEVPPLAGEPGQKIVEIPPRPPQADDAPPPGAN